MTRRRTPLAVAVMLWGLMLAPPASAAITEGPRLAAIYDIILQGRFSQANQELAKACPPAPAEACRTLSVVVLWWEILMDPYSRALDARFERDAKASIAAAEAWTKREPKRGESWFYLAGAYAPLVQWQALRGEHLAGARNGNRIRVALEKAIALDPSLRDAWFGIGMYHYWADVAPVAAKILRVLLFLPGGDREKGLKEMQQARNEGVLLAGEADFQLHWLYLWFEHKPEVAMDLVRSLEARYPSNPMFLTRIAEIENEYRHDHKASAAAWETLLNKAQRGQVESARIVEVRARLELARDLVELSQPQRAVELLKGVIASKPSAPYSAPAIAQLYLGFAYDRLGQRDLANAAFNEAIKLAPSDDQLDVRTRAREGLRKKPRA